MSASLLDELLADFATPDPANAANSANRQDCGGHPADSASCEVVRISANGRQATPSPAPNSQPFAAVRRPANTLESEERRGLSQDSQDSQACPPTPVSPVVLDLAAVSWTDADIARFTDRRARLLRWGWGEAEAERMAERLVIRDRGGDVRVSCTECMHYGPGRCGNYKAAALQSPEVGRDLAALLQRCTGFKSREMPT